LTNHRADQGPSRELPAQHPRRAAACVFERLSAASILNYGLGRGAIAPAFEDVSASLTLAAHARLVVRRRRRQRRLQRRAAALVAALRIPPITMDINLKTLIGKLNDTTRAAATRAAGICVGSASTKSIIEHLFLACWSSRTATSWRWRRARPASA
jgi:hypothetical protein